MQYKNFSEVLAYHRQKRIEVLKEMSLNMDPINLINTSILDDPQSIKDLILHEHEIQYNSRKCKLAKVEDQIQNIDRLRIVYLLPHPEMAKSNSILFMQSKMLLEKGHDVLLYSHCPREELVKGKVPFFVPHPDCRICEIVNYADIVIAGQWDMVVDAIKINAPLRYHFIHSDSEISGFSKLDKSIQQAIHSCFCLPLKIITDSDEMKESIERTFNRTSMVVPVPDNYTALANHNEKETPRKSFKKAPWRNYINTIEKEFKSSCQHTLQAIRFK